MKTYETYDEITGYDFYTDEFLCPDCGHLMGGQGILASCESDAHLADALVCPHCGKTIDADLPAYLLAQTEPDDPFYVLRRLAVRRIKQAIEAVTAPTFWFEWAPMFQLRLF